MKKKEDENVTPEEYQEFSNIQGHQFEHSTAKMLKRLNFDNVHVTPSSRDYGIDVIGKLRYHKSFGVQCKYLLNPHAHTIGYKAVEQTVSGVQYYHLNKGIVFTNGQFSLSAQHGAKQNHIILWNGSTQYLLQRILHAHLTIYDLLDYEQTILPFIKSLE